MATLAEHKHGELTVRLDEVHGMYKVKLFTTGFYLGDVTTASYVRAGHVYSKWVIMTLANAAPTTLDGCTLREMISQEVKW